MNVVVLAGGTSTEREISIISGQGVCEGLRQAGHRAILLDVFFGEDAYQASSSDAELFPEQYDALRIVEKMKGQSEQLDAERSARRAFFGPNVLEICSRADIVFMALHGANGEDGKVQATFDLYGIKYTGTGHLSSALAMDKAMTKLMLRSAEVPMPNGISLWRGQEIGTVVSYGLHFPVIVKPCCGGSSVGITIANNEEEFQNALAHSFSFEAEAIVEEYIVGREFSVAVIDKKAFPVIEIAPLEGFYDYKNKYSAGSAIETCPAELSNTVTEKMQEIAVRGAEALGIYEYCRLDFILSKQEEIYVLEANTLPGMTPTSLIPQEAAALGIDYPSLCNLLVDISMRKYEQMPKAF